MMKADISWINIDTSLIGSGGKPVFDGISQMFDLPKSAGIDKLLKAHNPTAKIFPHFLLIISGEIK